MQSTQAPIGIFDSGIGGLTVAAAIHELLPNERLVYFGDTAHLPYGDKSPAAIVSFSLGISRFLVAKSAKAIVIACNTASSLAFDAIQKEFGEQLPVINVIDPVVDHLAAEKNIRRVGVIGTKATIKSGLYEKKIRERCPALEVRSLATPLLAPMIEEGFFKNSISRTVIDNYLRSKELEDIDSLVLACTHYPLIQQEIEDYYNNSVEIINSAEIVAAHVQVVLEKAGQLATSCEGRHEFYVSDFTPSFEQSTRMFFGEEIHLEQENLWQ